MFNLKFAVKRLHRAAAHSQRAESKERLHLQRAMLASTPDKARVHAESAVRHRHQSMFYLRLAARIEAVVQRVQAAHSMRQVGDSMSVVVKEVERALEGDRLDEVARLMGRFEAASDNIAVQADSLQSVCSVPLVGAEGGVEGVGVDEVWQLMQQVADENGLAVDRALLGAMPPQTTIDHQQQQKVRQGDGLEDRLAKLREL